MITIGAILVAALGAAATGGIAAVRGELEGINFLSGHEGERDRGVVGLASRGDELACKKLCLWLNRLACHKQLNHKAL